MKVYNKPNNFSFWTYVLVAVLFTEIDFSVVKINKFYAI
jgi:hypothetical protein